MSQAARTAALTSTVKPSNVGKKRHPWGGAFGTPFGAEAKRCLAAAGGCETPQGGAVINALAVGVHSEEPCAITLRIAETFPRCPPSRA